MANRGGPTILVVALFLTVSYQFVGPQDTLKVRPLRFQAFLCGPHIAQNQITPFTPYRPVIQIRRGLKSRDTRFHLHWNGFPAFLLLKAR
jgi:hypothetical protein